MLNMAAMLPHSQPLHDTMMLVGKSQNPLHGGTPADDAAPALTTSSQLWCTSAGRELQAWELAELIGFVINKMVTESRADAWFRRRLGLAAHVANTWLILAVALSQPLQACLA